MWILLWLREASVTLCLCCRSFQRQDSTARIAGQLHCKVSCHAALRAPAESDFCCCSSEDVEKECCFILGLLAIKPEHQHSIADTGALAGLVGILKRHTDNIGCPMPGASVVRRAADAITNLAHENVPIKSRVRAEGGIPPLVTLLEAYDAKVKPHCS